MSLAKRKEQLQREIDISSKMIRRNTSNFDPMGYLFQRTHKNDSVNATVETTDLHGIIGQILNAVKWYSSVRRIYSVIMK